MSPDAGRGEPHLTRVRPTFEGWRLAARGLLAREIPPDTVLWSEAGDGQMELLGAEPEPAAPVPATHRVPPEFVRLAEAAACHASPGRWALLYRVLWRLTHGERALLRVAMDPDVHRLAALERAVRHEAHRMQAFVRFRAVPVEGGTHYVAWFEPQHHVVERVAPFFAERFPSMSWSILTPRRCAHWDGDSLYLGPGAPASAAPAPDALEALWRTYYASTFNPARARPRTQRSEMPVRYWKNLPEAQEIAPLLRDAPGRVRRMVEEQAHLPTKRPGEP